MIKKSETEIKKSWTYTEPSLLTVVVVVYNHENYISQTLDSILMQKTHFPFDIIVHDDCSTDKTVDILEKYAKEYPTIIKLILQKENQYSQGIKPTVSPFKKAAGKYIALCEGDDYWIDPNKLQIQLDEMCKFENCQMSFHSAIDKWEDNSKKDEIRTKQASGNKLFTANEIVLGGGGFCPTASIILEKEAVVNLPEWYKKAHFGDYFLQIFGSLKGGALYIDRTMSVYRRNSIGSWSIGMIDIEKRERGFENTVKTLAEMDRYFDKKFHSEIVHEKSKLYYDMAVFYLYNDMFEKFKKYIELSYKTYSLKTPYYLLDYYLRYFPRWLKILKILKNKLKV